MPKSIRNILIAFSLVTAAQAQTITLGVKGGVNVASLLDFSGAYPKNRIGFNAGIFGSINLTHIAIQPEVLFSEQGGKANGIYYQNLQGVPSNSPPLRARFNYLNFPILFKYYIVNALRVEAGPQVGFLLLAKEDGPGSVGPSGPTISTFDAKSRCNPADLSSVFGVGWDFIPGLTLDARYSLGLTPIIGGKARNQVIQVTLGIRVAKIKLGES